MRKEITDKIKGLSAHYELCGDKDLLIEEAKLLREVIDDMIDEAKKQVNNALSWISYASDELEKGNLKTAEDDIMSAIGALRKVLKEIAEERGS